MPLSLLLVATLLWLGDVTLSHAASGSRAPNIIFILADDLGCGDVHALTPASRIPTPNLDKLVAEGLSFNNAHAPAAVCTPSRYSFLTGRYSWRSTRKKGVAWVWEGPMIASDTFTIGQMLQHQGYHTACIGKWHLGLDWPTKDGLPASLQNNGTNVDYQQPLRNGPVTRGFNYYFGQEVPSFPPHAFIENDRLTAQPTAWLTRDLGGMPGAMAPGWRYEDLMFKLTDKALDCIKGRALHQPGVPFFLYFSMSAPHTPIAPHERFQGKTPVGRYGDYVFEMDYQVGRIIALLEELNLARDTLLIFTSDNGGVNEDGLKYDSAVGALVRNYGHNSSGPFRGMKSDAWEGGHRIPFIVRWPGHVHPHATSNALISLVDMMATFAALTGARLPNSVAEDSFDLSPVWEGKATGVRSDLIAQSGEGILALQAGDWKLVTCSAGGGKWSTVGRLATLSTTNGQPVWQNVQLYNTREDVGETNNLAGRYPEKVQAMMTQLARYVETGRSTPGPPLTQTPAKLWPEVRWVAQARKKEASP